MEELTKAMEILDKISFFGGQRAGRELWNDKPREVQDEDIASFNRDIEWLRDIIRKHMNDGWVTVEDRTPEESGYYRVTVKNKELGDITEETAWFAYVDDYDMDESEWRELYEYEEVIAWRELAPYNPERSNDEKE